MNKDQLNADRLMECFHAGMYEVLPQLVADADTSEEARKAVAELGRYLAEDAHWRGMLKQMKTRDGKRVWDWLRSELERRRPADAGAWWAIISHAEAAAVDGEVKAFFQ